MSYFPDKTPEQIAAVTDEEVGRIVNLPCAERGIPIFLDDIGEAPKPVVEPDCECFTVGHWTFRTKEQAEAVIKAVLAGERVKQGYDRRYNHTHEAVPDDSEVQIGSSNFYSPSQWHKYQSELVGFQSRKNTYEQLKRSAEEAQNRRYEVSNDVWKEVWKAQETVNEAARVAKLFERYVGLADGNRDVARKFLIAAEKFDESWTPPAVAADAPF